MQISEDTRRNRRAASDRLRYILETSPQDVDATVLLIASVPSDSDHRHHYMGNVSVFLCILQCDVICSVMFSCNFAI